MKKTISFLLAASMAAACLAGCSGGNTATQAVSSQAAEQAKDGAGGQEGAQEAADGVNADGTVNNPDKVKAEEGKLMFWSLFSGGDGEFMDKIIGDYNSSGPKMGVQSIMLVWADYYTKLQTAVAAGKGPDIGVSHASKLPELVDQGVVIPLNDYLEQLGADMDSMYSANSLGSVTFDGDVYAIPLDTHAEIMYYNKDVLDQAGVAVNSQGQLDISSADDFLAVLDQIKEVVPDGSALSLTSSGDDPYRVWWAVYFQMGGTPLINDDGTAVTMDREIAVKAADFVKSLYDKGYIITGIDEQSQYFQTGKAGLSFGGTWVTGAFEKTQNLNFGAQVFPKLFDHDSCWADSHTLIIPASKDRTEEETLEAVRFILAASSEGGLTWAGSGQIPACTDVLENKEYLDMPYRSDYMDALNTAVLPTKNPNFYAMKKGMIDSLNMLWTGQADSGAAIDNLYDELENNLQ